ncbi:hypothetical protein [Breoghania sp.]|uniref:hypothetical protein n=1 Tax=Breoghania sp. TaxID=2065378 RepID=UPI002620F4B3|nr:hypothetical protein [Breoghania sp.]MDJ0931096.1 hypothetical protein [Breoghania sp.]
MSIACVKMGGTTNSTVSVSSGSASITLEGSESIACTFGAVNSRERTTEVINRFLRKRVDMMLSNEPGQNRRIDRLRNRFGGGGTAARAPPSTSRPHRRA